MLAQRFILAVLCGALLELSAVGVAGIFAPGIEGYALVGCALGLLLAVAWIWDGLGLMAAAGTLAVLAGWVAGHWAVQDVTMRRAIFVTSEISRGSDPHAVFFVVAGTVSLSALCGWMVFDARQPWPVAALIGSCLLIRADISAAYGSWFPVFVAAVLLLVGVTFARYSVWQRLLPLVAVCVVVVGAAWALPTSIPAWSSSFTDPLRSVGGISTQSSESSVLSLTGSFHPSKAIVMSVRLADPTPRPYWRMRVFDFYNGHAWDVTAAQAHRVNANQSLGSDRGAAQPSTVRAHITLHEPTETLSFPGAPLAVNRPSFDVSRPSDGEPLSVDSQSLLPAGSSYVALGNLIPGPQPTTVSPYLQLPAIPEEVHALAVRLTQGNDRLDKIIRVERYLATSGTFRYDITAGSPTGRDAVDDFLFHTRRGYCNQFATAMAVLLREVRIPSRIISGYATGSFDGNAFIVRESDAHSWVEAYLPDRGWVQFEPTPGFSLDTSGGPGISSTGGVRSYPTPVPVKTAGTTTHRVKTHPRGLAQPHPHGPVKPPAAVISTSAVLAGIVALVAMFAYLSRPRSLSQVYRHMVRSRLIARPIGSAETPLEYVGRLPRNKRETGELIVSLYQQERYAGHRASKSEIERARRAWRHMRRLWSRRP